MAIEMNTRTKILAGVVVLAAAGAGAWFFLFQDDAPPPRPAVVAKPAATPPADAPKAAADAPKQADAAKPAAAPASGAKPIPTNPDQLIAQVIDNSGLKTYYQGFAREVMLRAMLPGQQPPTPAEFAAVNESVSRAFEPGAMSAEIAAKLKDGGFDAERMARFLEVLRQPIAVKMIGPEMRDVTPEAMKAYNDAIRKAPPSAERLKLIQTLDEVTRTSEVGTDMFSALARDMIDAMLDGMQKSGKGVNREARQMVSTQVSGVRNQVRKQMQSVMYVMYRGATDQELAEYVKLLDTDTGRWGQNLLAEAARPGLVARGSTLGRENAGFAIARQGAVAKAPVAPVPEAKAEEEKPAARPAALPAAPVEAPGYRRPANIRDIYSRYNDVVSATVMRDRTGVRELLDDGKSPNHRQSDGMTPLMIAASNGDTDIVALLLSKGADPTLRAGGRSALSIARARGSVGAGSVQLLERTGVRD